MRTCVVCGKEFFHSKLRKRTCSFDCTGRLWRIEHKTHHDEYNKKRYESLKEELRFINKKKYRKHKKMFRERQRQAYLRRKERLKMVADGRIN